MVRSQLALCTAAALLLPLAATADDRVVFAESSPFTLDMRPLASVDPSSRTVVVESSPFTLDTRPPASVDPSSRTVVVESGPFTLDTRLPASVDPSSRTVVVESGPFTLDTIEPPVGVWTNQFGLAITGATNQVVTVEACTNLANPTWQPLRTNALIRGSFYFSDPDWTNYPARFYRIRWQ